MLTGKALGEAIKSAVQKKIDSGAVKSKAAIARHFGIKTPSIYDWFNKGSIDKSKLPELWRYFSDVVGPDHWGLRDWPVMDQRVSDPDGLQASFDAAKQLDQIGTPIIEWEKPEDLPEGEFVIVPRYDLHVAAGNGHVVYEEMEHEQGQAYRTNSIRKLGSKASNLMTVYAKGDSMEPSIYAGDALLVDRGQREVQDRNVYVLRYGHEIRVKRLFKRPDGGLRIVSDNTNGFPEEVVTAAEMEHIEIIGRVVERSGRM